MLKRTNTTQILISQDATTRGIAADALSQLPASQVTVRDMPVFEDLYSDATTNSASTDVNVKLPETHNPDALAIILHSSGKILCVAGDLWCDGLTDIMSYTGSTGHPKPIPWTHRRLALFGRGPRMCL